MTRNELVRQVAARTGRRPTDADAAVKALLAVVGQAMARDGRARLAGSGAGTGAGFGTFIATNRTARAGRNPRTGAPVEVPDSRGVRFPPGNALRHALDREPGPGQD